MSLSGTENHPSRKRASIPAKRKASIKAPASPPQIGARTATFHPAFSASLNRDSTATLLENSRRRSWRSPGSPGSSKGVADCPNYFREGVARLAAECPPPRHRQTAPKDQYRGPAEPSRERCQDLRCRADARPRLAVFAPVASSSMRIQRGLVSPTFLIAQSGPQSLSRDPEGACLHRRKGSPSRRRASYARPCVRTPSILCRRSRRFRPHR